MKPAVKFSLASIASAFVCLAAAAAVLSAPPGSHTKKPRRKTVPATAPAAVSAADTAGTLYGKVFGRFMDMYARGIQEKLYLQTDKPYYCAGDTIWFKGHLVNAITHVPQMPSNYIYVELIDRDGSVVKRAKIKRDEHGFHNAIALDADMPAGEYLLRGYTLWMLNDEDHLFSRVISVANPLDERLTVEVAYRQPENGKPEDGQQEAVITMRGADRQPLDGARVTATLTQNGKSSRMRLRADRNGTVSVPFSPGAGGNSIALEVESGDKIRRHTVYTPDLTDGFDVQFFPEGGPLIRGELQRVAFKAINSDGLSVEVSGGIFDPAGELVTEIKSSHKGMGCFVMMASADSGYYARVRTEEGVEKRFGLPAATAGYALKVMSMRGRLMCQAIRSGDMPADSLGIVIHSRGRFLTANDFDAGHTNAIDMEGLPPGILHLTLIHKGSGQPVSQRLAFIPPQDGPAVTVTPDRASYGPRRKVGLSVGAAYADGTPVRGGTFAVSVTDRNAVRRDSLEENINSCLLLTSDLRGYIEDPGSYFCATPAVNAANLDVLMMTQGWSRFDIAELLAGKPDAKRRVPSFETTQRIKGSVRGFFGGAAHKPSIIVISPQTRYMDAFSIDEGNRFILDSMDFADTVSFVIQALTRGGNNRMLTLDVEPETRPESTGYIPPPRGRTETETVPQTFLSQSKMHYYYSGGTAVIDLDEVVVTSRQEEKKTSLPYSTAFARSIGGETLSHFAGSDIFTVISTLPGVRIVGDSLYVRGSNQPPLIFFDNLQVEIGELRHLDVAQIERIDLIAGPEASIFGPGASGGVIVVVFKDGADINVSRPTPASLVHVRQRGYKPPVHFYQPRYDVAEALRRTAPDVRTTLLWDPCVALDENGRAKIWFYTADNPAVYDVILEGVTPLGEVCRTAVSVERK